MRCLLAGDAGEPSKRNSLNGAPNFGTLLKQ
jgi:hypothetical protein